MNDPTEVYKQYLRQCDQRILQRNNWLFWYERAKDNPVERAHLERILMEWEKSN